MNEPPVMYVDRQPPVGVAEHFADRCVLRGPGLEAAATAEAIIASGARWDAARMDQVPNARVLSRSGVGYDNVDLEAAAARGIVVCIAPDAPTVSTAEHAVAMILAAAKHLVPNQLRLRAGTGDYFAANRAIELAGRTLGLVGYGRIARRVRRAAAALDMTVIAHDPYLDEADVELVSFPELLERADVISVHAPLTPTTRHLFDAAAFAAMRPGVIFVNVARGGLVDQDALLAALDRGHVSGAALDVTDPEPLPVGHRLLGRDDVLVTPHIASATVAGRLRLYEHAIDNALAVLSGRRPREVVNPEVLEAVR
jgi:D-3-phosphoglycerate dehydrogenase / 2-oxoglutarate reductase